METVMTKAMNHEYIIETEELSEWRSRDVEVAKLSVKTVEITKPKTKRWTWSIHINAESGAISGRDTAALFFDGVIEQASCLFIAQARAISLGFDFDILKSVDEPNEIIYKDEGVKIKWRTPDKKVVTLTVKIDID